MELYTAEELAKKCKVSKQTIYRWGRTGKIEKVQPDPHGKVRYPLPKLTGGNSND